MEADIKPTGPEIPGLSVKRIAQPALTPWLLDTHPNRHPGECGHWQRKHWPVEPETNRHDGAAKAMAYHLNAHHLVFPGMFGKNEVYIWPG